VKGALAGLILLAIGCAQPPPQPTAEVWPATLSLTRVDFSCRLPVLDFAMPGVSDAFINLPAGTLTPAGTGGFSYDQVVERWLPVARNAISPDGRQYAIAKDWALSPPSPTRIHVVDAATGTDVRVATMPDNRPYVVADFTSAGVSLVPNGDAAEPGVWRLNLETGALTKISDGNYQPPVGEWIGVVDPRDPNHQVSHATGFPVPQPDRIDRRDASGKTTTWMYKPGYWLYWFAFVGSPLLLVEASRVVDGATRSKDDEYWLVSGPGRSTRLAGFSGDELSPYRDLVIGSGMADQHGIWITGAKSMYLIRRNGSILLVADHGGVPVNACA
jgi:hypothetical protein